MNPLLTIPLALGGGFLSARLSALPATAPRYLNRLVIWVLLPAITFVEIHALAATADASSLRRFVMPVSMAWILFALATLVFLSLGKALKWERETIGALILTAGLGNTSFVGYPVIQALYGDPGLKIAILADQPGTFLVLSFLGITVAALASGKHENFGEILAHLIKRVLSFPAIYALILGIALRKVEIPQPILSVLWPLGKSMAAVALFSVGFQWNPRELFRQKDSRTLRAAGLGLSFKLVLAPLLFLALYSSLGVRGLDLRVIVLESGMGPMVSAGIVAAETGLDARIVLLMLGIGIPLSFVTLPIFALLLR